MFGELGDTGELELKNSETNLNKFERNRVDLFVFKGVLSLGELTKVRIRHDNTGTLIGNTHWHLEHVRVVDMSTGRTYTFECKKWLSLSKDDKQLVRDLKVSAAASGGGGGGGTDDPRASNKSPLAGAGGKSAGAGQYEINVVTMDEPNAGTKHNALIVLIDEHGQETKPKMLENTIERKILRRYRQLYPKFFLKLNQSLNRKPNDLIV